jgi:ABC-type Na+ efflux pump permease subunit
MWKEWHEQWWKLCFGCVVLGAMALIGLRARILADLDTMGVVCVVALTLLPVVSSTGLVAAEREQGGFESLVSLPVSAGRILAAKAIIGVLLCVGPIAVAALVSIAEAGGRETDTNSILILYAHAALASAALFFWMFLLTIDLPSEARAALVACGIYVISLMATAALQQVPAAWIPMATAISPVGLLIEPLRLSPPLLLAAGVQALILTPLWFWALRRLRPRSCDGLGDGTRNWPRNGAGGRT